ncbi:MAG: energy-coupled thiamine transporter ThiT [Christensenellaceae bacterium]|nr:energy-coupled thiamine transporter ThiT [Christensenellaceae bacterium]
MNNAIGIIFAVLYYTVTFYFVRDLKIRTRDLAFCGIVIAMTLILQSIRFPLPTGATISLCSPVPLLLLAVLIDYRLSFITGWICGVLAMLIIPGWQLVHWGQFFLEHMICFSCLGYAGIFGTDKRYKIIGGMILASVLKIAGHLISGVLFFSQNAWDGWGAWGYSLAYNLSQNVPLCILSAVIVLMLPLKSMRSALNMSSK